MRTIHHIAALLLCLGLSACATVGADIQTETVVDPKANLAGYESYAWVGSVELLKDESQQWAPVSFDLSSELRFLIDRELKERGMHFAETEPDLLVSYLLVIDMDAQAEQLKARYGQDVDLSNLHEGGLLIALADPETSKLVWAGAATAQVKKERSDAESRERLSVAVDKIFESFKR